MTEEVWRGAQYGNSIGMNDPTASVDVLVGGRYRLIEELGAGGMAVVWQGFDTVLGRRVAVKILNQHLAADPLIAARLRNEARAVAQLTHPNVTQVYDYGADQVLDGSMRPFVVMELVGGQTLASLIRGGAMLPWQQATAIVSQVAAALAAAHERGIVHRDVTPNNVMVGARGVKVLDFGIAALHGEPDSPDGASDGPLGTPAYVAPERLTTPGGGVGPAVDVYSLGMMWYRAIAGHLPWPAASKTQLLQAHLTSVPLALPATPDMPAELVELCMRCLAKDPASRPTSAALEDDLVPYATPTTPASGASPASADGVTELLAWTQVRPGTQELGERAVPDTTDQPRSATDDTRRAGLRRITVAAMGAGVLLAVILSGVFLTRDTNDLGQSNTRGPTITGQSPAPGVTVATGTPSLNPTGGPSPIIAGVPTPGPSDDLATATVTPASTPPNIEPPSLPPGTAVAGVGGTAWITCNDKVTTIVGVTPNSSYLLTEAKYGPASDVKAVFQAVQRRTEISAKCDHGVLQPHVDER
jgi:serine/threonine protein kinase